MDPSPEALKRYLEDNKFDVVAMKVFTKRMCWPQIKTAKIIRSITPSAVIIIGGPHPPQVTLMILWKIFRTAISHSGERG